MYTLLTFIPKMQKLITDAGLYIGFVKQQKGACLSLHNHPIPTASKVCSLVKELITNATTLNPTVKPFELAKGQGLPVIPGVVDKASNHLGGYHVLFMVHRKDLFKGQNGIS